MENPVSIIEPESSIPPVGQVETEAAIKAKNSRRRPLTSMVHHQWVVEILKDKKRIKMVAVSVDVVARTLPGAHGKKAWNTLHRGWDARLPLFLPGRCPPRDRLARHAVLLRH